jgi:hypothetical protein
MKTLINVILFASTGFYHPAYAMHDTLVDFTQPINHIEVLTDATERSAGLSHAYAGYQNSQNNKSHFFFAHLQPQPNGAAFATFRVSNNFDFGNRYSICLNAKSLNNKDAYYQVVVETPTSQSLGFTYKKDFQAQPQEIFSIPFYFSDFDATRRGKSYPSAPYLEPNDISSIAIRIIGRAGQNADIYQKGLFGLQLLNITSDCKTQNRQISKLTKEIHGLSQ